ncbi:hypothetical protein FOZ63_009687, partial [Perkinsus olseni]
EGPATTTPVPQQNASSSGTRRLAEIDTTTSGWMFPSTTTVSLTDELGGVSTGSSPILMAGVLYTKVEVHATGGYEFTTGFHPAPALKMVLAITDRTRCNELQYETTVAKVDTVNSSDLAQPTRLYQSEL